VLRHFRSKMSEPAKVTKAVKARNAFIHKLALNGKHSAEEIIKLANEIVWREADEQPEPINAPSPNP
jgi:hypothetical protein